MTAPKWPPSGEEVPESLLTGAPDAARALMAEYWAFTHFNGFDWRLGRFVPTHYPANDKGAMLILRPMSREWHGSKPTVLVEWVQALSIKWVEEPDEYDEESEDAKDFDYEERGHWEGGCGEGTITMKWVCALADKHGVILDLSAGNTGSGGRRTMKPVELIPFYEKFGFIVSGRKGSNHMVRLPVQK